MYTAWLSLFGIIPNIIVAIATWLSWQLCDLRCQTWWLSCQLSDPRCQTSWLSWQLEELQCLTSWLLWQLCDPRCQSSWLSWQHNILRFWAIIVAMAVMKRFQTSLPWQPDDLRGQTSSGYNMIWGCKYRCFAEGTSCCPKLCSSSKLLGQCRSHT